MIVMIMARQIISLVENEQLNLRLSAALELVRDKSDVLLQTNQELEEQIVAHQEARDRLSYAASHDVLTGLPNRTYLMDYLNTAIQHSRLTHQRTPPLCSWIVTASS
jgi:PleD family two-component response regulator